MLARLFGAGKGGGWTLRLEVLLHGFEINIAESTRDQGREELGAVNADVFFLSKKSEDRCLAGPVDRDGDVE